MNTQTISNPSASPPPGSQLDPFDIVGSSLAVQQFWLRQPERLATVLQNLALDAHRVHDRFARTSLGIPSEPAVAAVIHDQRFQNSAWIEQPGFAYLKEMYLLYSRYLEDTIYATEDIDPTQRQRAAFWVRQWLDAIAPTNFFWTNPEALRRGFASHGFSVLSGLQNWLRDLAAGNVRMVEPDAFQIGRDLAATPGQVVLRNELLELIQYTPTTDQVRAIPVVLVAPWINKYYIMDLGPDNSLVRFLRDQGFTVFITSWKNPGPEARAATLDDYLLKGVRPALEAARAICGVPQVHATGYCLGGTSLALLLAWFNADPTDRAAHPIAHWTTFTTLVDFSDPGEIGVFLSENSFEFLRKRMNKVGYLDGADMASAFRMLRPNNLIWHYVMHSYLYGEELPPSDVLFWNCDTTRMPAAMHEFYLRELYLNNRLVQGSLEIGGRRLDLGAIQQPLYAVGAEQDHIAPWKQTFRLCGLIGGPARYVLATSGHILGIINPPVTPPKRRYWVGDASGSQDAAAWQEATAKAQGSWWEDWVRWLNERCGPLGPPPPLGNSQYPPLDTAPGRYVLEK
ncbi:MAG: alpha/beta fold hydrolase [Candidatus Competibacteraceae bacterium]|uniref:Polyhydroxyalkanoate synthase n=1 Tax=Candidatus Contendobacter odensis Run_B_J11 TaxID=1400861 RepID=A0A7U7J2Y0_9GAMM|nr:alpha/beta fold hydrolase [Candidatus Contendobacter odensis]MBK8535598.1 alpha/beta fold hydrolase [Candidatus Competibacteraceae bacterium]MBK8755330.1 alpha/beta fold hydrolase [Candidatus Competibacteraceae bacterium]CDH43962.1 Polyhydroxyalkanoate synthase [Candidatus Contendobacter odensis Run_B_J11]